MRFSAVQEDGYGVGLGQETPPNDVDESMMAATGDVEPGGGSSVEEGSMISNLPLLFANGYPTSLDKITLPELERFITFMVQCSLGHDTAEVISEPQWWSKEIKFSIPLVRPKKVNDNYMDNLKKLVFRCYTYHRSEYLLRFCAYLAQYPHEKLEYVNNWDSTTSLYLKTTKKLLVTFRNENMNYDRVIEGPKRMGLISMNRAKTKYTNGTKCLRRRSAQKQAPSPAMVEPPMDDIYLCDNCDAELVGLGKMKEHEKLCYRVEPRPITPEAEVQPELKQDQFMGYFKLKPSNPPDPSLQTNDDAFKDRTIPNRSSSRIRGSNIILARCPTIPFSSPAGRALAKKSKMMTELIQRERLDRIERHLTAPPITSTFKPKWFTKTYDFVRWSVTYKPRTDKSTKNHDYVHQYNFSNYSGKPVLNLRSQLLYIACKPIYVAMEVLTDEKLAALMREPSSYKSPECNVPCVRLRLPSVEPEDEPEPGDESNPIIIDLEDDEEWEQQSPASSTTPQLQSPTAGPLHAYFQPLKTSPPFTTSTTMQTMATITPVSSRSRTGLKRTRHSAAVAARPNVTAAAKSTAKPIIYVDLCSSDEDEADSSACAVTTNENLDPRQITTTAATEVCVDSSFLHDQNLTPSKLAKPCVSPADSTSNGLTKLNVNEPQKDGLLRNTPVLRSTP